MAQVPIPDGADIASFLGRQNDPRFVDLCSQHVYITAQFVRGYVRGQGFTLNGTECEEDLASVITTAASRLVINPGQVEREGADGWYAVGAFNGFTLPELAILHSYRRRSA